MLAGLKHFLSSQNTSGQWHLTVGVGSLEDTIFEMIWVFQPHTDRGNSPGLPLSPIAGIPENSYILECDASYGSNYTEVWHWHPLGALLWDCLRANYNHAQPRGIPHLNDVALSSSESIASPSLSDTECVFASSPRWFCHPQSWYSFLSENSLQFACPLLVGGNLGVCFMQSRTHWIPQSAS